MQTSHVLGNNQQGQVTTARVCLMFLHQHRSTHVTSLSRLPKDSLRINRLLWHRNEWPLKVLTHSHPLPLE